MLTSLLVLALLCSSNAVASPPPSPLPSTFTFINKTYAGTRFAGKVIIVAGGTSGIGFASAAMFVQECARGVVILGQNEEKGALAASVINADASQAHCGGTTTAGNNDAATATTTFVRADTRNRTELRAALAFAADTYGGRIDAVVNTAGIAGWALIGLPDIPDDAWLGSQDAIYNNLYGCVNLMAEAMRFWQMHGCVAAIGQPACPQLGYTPAIVNVASMQGLTPTPSMLMYGVSKAGIISATQTVASAYAGSLRANVVAPGLISTPLTWDQVRAWRMGPNGALEHPYPNLQTSFQCVVDGNVTFGDCPGGGKGYGCPCPDVALNDPRVKAMFEAGGFWPLVDPRHVGASIVYLASDEAKGVSGQTYVVDHDVWDCQPQRAIPPALTKGQCYAPSAPAPVPVPGPGPTPVSSGGGGGSSSV